MDAADLTIPADVPVNPFRSELYSAEELLGEYDAERVGSYTETVDFAAYRTFVVNGRALGAPEIQSIVRALHDNAVTRSRTRFLTGRRVVGLMGGHRMRRDDPTYRAAATLSARLSAAGCTMASGGGPGAMEATHLGAHCGEGERLDAALDRLARHPAFPDGIGGIVAPDGTVDAGAVERLHRWQEPAFAVRRADGPRHESLAVPTWHYGHEPPTPLASHIAKYFHNAIREDGLLAVAQHGVVFFPGHAGTVQEIFQDAAQNHYESFGWFSPMVLFDCAYWTETFPVEPVLRRLFADDAGRDLMIVTDDLDEAVDHLTAFTPPG